MTEITMLSSMADPDFEVALDRHLAWGLRYVDLKDGIWGKSLLELTDREAWRAADALQKRRLKVWCLSTVLFHPELEEGEPAFRKGQLEPVTRAIALAQTFEPELVRLLACQTRRRAELQDSIAYLQAEQPWVVPMYGEAIDQLTSAGHKVTIENEVGGCILSRPAEVLNFFAALDRPDRVSYTYDVQNLWEMGTPPSVEVYRQLSPLIHYLHLKGGLADPDTGRLRCRSGLEDADWPVDEIVRAAVQDGVSPVLCLNSSHGAAHPQYDFADVTARDVAYLQRLLTEIEA